MLDYHLILVLAGAFILDALIGDPCYPFHPVRLTGGMISGLKKLFFEIELKNAFAGALLSVVTVLLVLNIYILLRILTEMLHTYATLALDIFAVYSVIALKDMTRHAKPVAQSLEESDIDKARKALARIVGRDPAVLDKHGIARAAVESVSESFVDGFFAPVFWYAVAASIAHFTALYSPSVPVGAMLAYRTVNTLDSMIGHKSEEFRKFGTFAAKLDDILNFLPARLAIIILIPAAAACRLDVKQGIKIAKRDRLKHESPNSAHAESFVAGALGLKLGGATKYPHGMVEKPWLGDGTPDAIPDQIITACRLVACAGWITILAASAILF